MRVPFTAEDLEVIRADFAAWVPVSETAHKVGRSVGVVRQTILRLRLRRPGVVSQVLKWAPPHLASQVGAVTPAKFVASCYKWRDAQKHAAKVARRAAKMAPIQQACAAIDRRRDLSRNEKMMAKRQAGMTLAAIGQQYGITRERVRQLTKSKSPLV